MAIGRDGSKRGISPIVATILIVFVAGAALFSVFFFTRTVVVEDIQKFGAPIADACSRLQFTSELSSERVLIDNSGDIPIYAVNLVISKDGEEVTRFLRPKDGLIDAKESDFVSASISDLSGKIDVIVAVPIIIGKVSDPVGGSEANKLHTCTNQGQRVL